MTLRQGDYKGWAWWLIPVIPDTQEAEIGRTWFKAIPVKKLARPYLNKMWWFTPINSNTAGGIDRKFWSEASPGQKTPDSS
jgi:hypothetical protein